MESPIEVLIQIRETQLLQVLTNIPEVSRQSLSLAGTIYTHLIFETYRWEFGKNLKSIQKSMALIYEIYQITSELMNDIREVYSASYNYHKETSNFCKELFPPYPYEERRQEQTLHISKTLRKLRLQLDTTSTLLKASREKIASLVRKILQREHDPSETFIERCKRSLFSFPSHFDRIIKSWKSHEHLGGSICTTLANYEIKVLYLENLRTRDETVPSSSETDKKISKKCAQLRKDLNKLHASRENKHTRAYFLDRQNDLLQRISILETKCAGT